MIEEMRVVPVTLEGRYVRLEPLTRGHVEALSAVGLDPELWRWIPVPERTREEMAAYVETALHEQASGMALPFVQVEKRAGGSSAARATAISSVPITASKLDGPGSDATGSVPQSIQKRNSCSCATRSKHCAACVWN